MKVLFLFLDGVGIGDPDPGENPFFAARLPTLERALGGIPSLARVRYTGPEGTSFALDATLGVEGLPQSGTGQYALLTGDNGAQRIGRHQGPWTPTALRPLLLASNLFTRARDEGQAVAFANAHPPRYRESRWYKRPAPVPMAADGAGLMTRGIEDLMAGDGLASDLDNARMQTVVEERLPTIHVSEAGANLARLAGQHDLTVFAHYGTDVAGHRGGAEAARIALERVDGFLGGILAHRPDSLGVLVASDHGNIESVQAGHTRNPALGIWFPGKDRSPGIPPESVPGSLLEVCGWTMERLQGKGGDDVI